MNVENFPVFNKESFDSELLMRRVRIACLLRRHKASLDLGNSFENCTAMRFEDYL